MNPQEQKKLEAKVIGKLAQKLGKKDKIILAFSGGADSVFLLEMLKKIPLKKLIIAHLNHSLRAKESDGDEEFTKKIAGENIQIETLKLDIKKIAAKSKLGLEETGRKYRYKFFYDIAKNHHANHILTAHHADDNLETVLLNFIRGASIKGLSGMEECSKVHNPTGPTIFRPLLEVTKKEILAYLKTKKIPFRTDKSNKDLTYRRNYLRHKIVPELTKLNPSLPQTLAQNSKNIRQIANYLEQQAQEWVTKNVNTKLKTSTFAAQKFKKQSPALQQQIILEIHRALVGDTQNIETIHVEEVLQIITQNIGNKKKRLGKTVFMIKKNIVSCSRN